jgi:hypothetical protein
MDLFWMVFSFYTNNNCHVVRRRSQFSNFNKEKIDMKQLIIGDLHLRDVLPYSDIVHGGRTEEEKEVLDFIIAQSTDCDSVVLLGDVMNGKVNSSMTIKKLVNFLEQFGDKEIYILSGNHTKLADGRDSLDFLAEIRNKQWTVVTKEILYDKWALEVTDQLHIMQHKRKIFLHWKQNTIFLEWNSPSLIHAEGIARYHHIHSIFKSWYKITIQVKYELKELATILVPRIIQWHHFRVWHALCGSQWRRRGKLLRKNASGDVLWRIDSELT